jgi:cyclopropane-fatty-acyl-phospholipid synthase
MGLLPDRIIRAGIRRLNCQRLDEIHANDLEQAAAMLNEFTAAMSSAPIAPVPQLANEQHYELPAEFFGHVLGRNRKYSCCHWTPTTQSLDDAEAAALQLTCERAGIVDGTSVLDLGCGWG